MAVVTETFTAEDINAVAKENRRFAYTQESDPLLWKYKEAMLQWKSIKQKYKK